MGEGQFGVVVTPLIGHGCGQALEKSEQTARSAPVEDRTIFGALPASFFGAPLFRRPSG
jgi:hypothetical protein